MEYEYLSDISEHDSLLDISEHDFLSDTSDIDFNDFNEIENNEEIKNFCDKFINDIKSITELNKIIFNENITSIFGLNKYFIGYYVQKNIYLKEKNKINNEIKNKKILDDIIEINEKIEIIL